MRGATRKPPPLEGRPKRTGRPRPPRHSDGNAAQLGVVPLVDGRVERVQVDMQDRPRPVVGSCHLLCRRQSATTTCGLPLVQGVGVGLAPSAVTTFSKTFDS